MFKQLCFVIFLIIVLVFVVIVINYRKLGTIQKICSEMINTGRVSQIDIPILYINLDRYTDRNKSIQNQCKKLSLQPTRIPGVNGSEIQNIHSGMVGNIKFENEYRNFTSKKLSQNELACTLSHLKAIQFAYEMNEPYVLIVEDDVFLGTSALWKYKLSTILKSLPVDAGILTIYSCNHFFPGLTQKYKIKSRPVDRLCGGCVAYVVTRLGMRDILSKVLVDRNHFGIYKKLNASCAIADYLLWELTKTYQMEYPLLVTTPELNMASTIHNCVNFGMGTWKSINVLLHYDRNFN
jgi:hypothetical protein